MIIMGMKLKLLSIDEISPDERFMIRDGVTLTSDFYDNFINFL